MFKNFRIGTKQAIAFGVILVIMAAVNYFAITKLGTLRDEIATISQERLPANNAIAALNDATSDLRIAQLQHAVTDSLHIKNELSRQMIFLMDQISDEIEIYEPLISSEQERAVYEEFDRGWERYLELAYEFVALSQANRNTEALQLLNGEARFVFAGFTSHLQRLVEINSEATRMAGVTAERVYSDSRKTLRTLLLVTILFSLLMTIASVRLLTKPLRRLSHAAQSVADGNLDVSVKVETSDEVGMLGDAFNRMTRSLQSADADIREQQRKLTDANVALQQKNVDLENALVQLREAQQQLVMQEKMASLGNLVAGVAHEINNPVGAVSSAADTTGRSLEIINRAIQESTNLEELRENKRVKAALGVLTNNHGITIEASSRITRIVQSLKNFARLDEAEFQEADIHEGIDSTLTLLEHQTKNRVTIAREYGTLPRVHCYPNQLNQVFMNILSNSAQSIKGQGTIAIRTRRDGDFVVVEFADDGVGISEKHLARIFDPGFTTKGVGVGTGLGLSISYNIVRKHQGQITAASSVGHGTTMTVRLPIRPQKIEE